jgi:hypothetical protein
MLYLIIKKNDHTRQLYVASTEHEADRSHVNRCKSQIAQQWSV